MPTWGTYKAPAMPHSTADKPAFGVAYGGQHAAQLGLRDHARHDQGACQRRQRDPVQRGARAGRRDVEAQDALEVGKAVVAAEARVVAEEQQHGGERQRLRDDREVHALDARAEGEVAKDERQHARHQHHQQHGVPEVLGEGPVPGVALPVQEHHEVGQVALVDAVAADGAHQVHAVRIAAQREEQAVAQRQDAGVAPHQVQRQRSHRVAHELAQQRHGIG
ncbi:hypothetical protein G6F65_018588 [Rhizopus arrhizus]|nr:hypothetical protein G6F65_018588 [Rhizopus arrhizus]